MLSVSDNNNNNNNNNNNKLRCLYLAEMKKTALSSV